MRSYAAKNFRDLGGHPAANSRRVRAGRIFRSSHLAEVPPESPISRLKLRTLVTLQSRAEVKHMGAPEPASRRGVRWEHIPMGDEWFSDQGYTEIAAQTGRDHLALVMHFRRDWRRFFKLLAERDVYPCSFIVPPAAIAPGLAPRCCCRCSGSIAIESSPTFSKATWSSQASAHSRATRSALRIDRRQRRYRRLHARGDRPRARRTRHHSGRSAGRLTASAARSPSERSSRQVAVAQQRLGDDHPLHFTGALADFRELGVAHVALDREIGDVAVAAVDLHGFDR